MARLVVSVATRNRAQQLMATLPRHMACFSRPDTKVIVQCDSDDFATVAMLGAAHDEGKLDPRISINVKKRDDTVAGKWNRGLSEPGDLYLNASDDDVYITPNTDELLLEAAGRFPDGIGIVYGRMANASFPSVIAYTAKWAEKNDGKLQPEYFPYWFADHWTDDVGRIIGRISFADVGTDQSGAGKTMEMREPGWWATWFDAAYLMRRAEAHKIVNDPDFQTPQWHKEILLRHHPLIEYRSKWINDTVRAQSRQLDMMSGLNLKDERYLRIKQRAIDMVPHLLDDYGMDKAQANAFREALSPSDTIVSFPRAYAG